MSARTESHHMNMLLVEYNFLYYSTQFVWIITGAQVMLILCGMNEQRQWVSQQCILVYKQVPKLHVHVHAQRAYLVMPVGRGVKGKTAKESK